MRRQFSILLALVFGVLVFATGSLLAQATQGTILGTVTDASGAAIPGATVTVRNEGTNMQRTIHTDAEGDYRIAGLEAGSYEVTVTTDGFNTFEQTQVDLTSSQIKRVDAAMEVGDVATTITVEGGTTQIETETVTLTNVKTSRDYTQLPLSIFGRGWANITNVTAGVQSKSGFEVNGARDTANNFTTDGISVNDIISSRNTNNGFSGEVEVLREVKIMTANNRAEYPQIAQFQAVTKSGTNDLHGSLYWGIFNSVFSARNWNDPRDPSFTNHNMFAVTNGGPVYIPKVYDGRNRTFYFFSYGGARYRVGGRKFLQVPTAAFRQGDFSALTAGSLPGADQIVITDPANNDTPFPNNTLPQSRLSSVSLATQDLLYPDPNTQGTGIYGLNQNYTADPGGKFDSDVYSIRIDHQISNNNNLFVRTGLTINNKDTWIGGLKSGYGRNAWRGNSPDRTLTVSDTHTFSPSIVNEFKFGYKYQGGQWFDPNIGPNIVDQIGLQGIGCGGDYDPAKCGMPAFNFGGQAGGFEGTSTWANGNRQRQHTFQFIDNLSWFRGRHSFKVGLDIRRYQINDRRAPQSMRGQFNFDDRLSNYSYSNFLLGYLSFSRRSIPRPASYPRSSQYGFYIQDDFKINQNMTLNVGLRYEYQSPWVEKFDRMFSFDTRSGSFVTAGSTVPDDLVPAVAENLTIISAADAGFPIRSLVEADKNNFTPRLGLAIRPFGDTTTVVRLGWGLYNQMQPGLVALDATGGPWESNEDFRLAGNNPDITFPNPFETTSGFSGVQSVSGARSVYFPHTRTQQWSASVGRQILGIALDVGYVGTSNKKTPYQENWNLLHPGTEPYDPARQAFPDFNVVNVRTTGTSSIYHGLTVQADRRMGNGLWFNINYTLAKAITDGDLRGFSPGIQQNQYQRYLERADDQRIRRHTLRFSYIYEFPYGRGKRWGGNLPTAADLVLGGWQISGITTMVTGQRLSPSFSGSDAANTNQFGGRPDRIGDGNLDGSMGDRVRAGQPIFDKSAFVRPESGRGFYGNSARYFLTGPGEMTWNFVLAKNFEVKERARLQFRWEMFNAPNRANFKNPNRNIQSGNFGLVTRANRGRTMLFGLRLDY